MANTIRRSFIETRAAKDKLAVANEKTSVIPVVGTEYRLTGNFAVENGWVDRNGNRRNTDRVYAYFEGSRNGKVAYNGISAGVFLRRPFSGFTDDEQESLTDFHKSLLNCLNAEDFFDLIEENNAWNKTIVVKDVIRHLEVVFGTDEVRPIRYAIFDLIRESH